MKFFRCSSLKIVMFRRVLVTLDGSPLSEAVLPHVAQLVSGTDTSVTLLGVVETRGQAFMRAKDEVKGYLEEKAHSLRAKGIEVETVSRLGPPAESIIDYAATHDVDFIMMSTHGRTGLGRIIFGSVAGSVLKSGI